jgi:AcrR family transcriptional regulator
MEHAPGRLHADERKAQILRCATAVFARSNYRVAGIAEIAKDAGISEPTVYKYFPSKKQLFLEILRKVGEVTLRQWQEATAGEPDAIDVLKRIARTQFEATISRPELLKVQFQALSETDDDEIRGLLRENFASYVAFLAGQAKAGSKDHGAAPDEAQPRCRPRRVGSAHFRARADRRAAAASRSAGAGSTHDRSHQRAGAHLRRRAH